MELSDSSRSPDLSAVQVDHASSYMAEDTSFIGFEGEVCFVHNSLHATNFRFRISTIKISVHEEKKEGECTKDSKEEQIKAQTEIRFRREWTLCRGGFVLFFYVSVVFYFGCVGKILWVIKTEVHAVYCRMSRIRTAIPCNTSPLNNFN